MTKQDAVWGGIYTYRVLPIPVGTASDSSLIGKNYDLIFCCTTAPCVEPIYSDDEDDDAQQNQPAPQVYGQYLQDDSEDEEKPIESDDDEEDEKMEDDDEQDEDEDGDLVQHGSFRSTKPIFDRTTEAKWKGAAWKS